MEIGVDILSIKRIRKIIEKYQSRFVERFFSASEIRIANDLSNKAQMYAFYAKRFAAKEAILKALGTGFARKIQANDISILNDALGKPIVHLNERVREIIESILQADYKFSISLSDEKEYAIAYAMLQTV